ncbi:MAG: hypothetical protein H6948_18040 [Zoogloeaceae bacterium]|nr:hypothetical protein [Zoogloeaceae bacterium]MCP5253332.1 hypothetical protein [Zoogloeaceae bacterium]MCW5617238.1 hypothetical protein [Rhodocyclaceae bacterium]
MTIGTFDTARTPRDDHESTQVFVCVATGDFYGMAETYVERMAGMLRQFAPAPFKLICVTDRARQLDPSIEQIDCTAWQELRARGGRATRLKLGLFNPAYIPYTEFVYLDLTLVIRASLGPLLEFSRSQETDLVIVNGWFYDGYNSCVMRIRPAGLRFIYEDFVSGREYPAKIPGDQDYITGSLRAHGVEATTFPPEQIVSFKQAIREGLGAPAAASHRIGSALIVKFHGKPKMHQIFRPWYRFFKYGLRYLGRGRLAYPFSIADLERCWSSNAPARPAEK